ncbi:CHAP domain-containing protein [Mycolicibacterium llatzerense]|uniref:CHAP domain-containing protein n=1 Tax=Mycolicibacterium llatzerense TaxID=280871 RepID=UPI0021B5556A|nr:CHAP domain-containing protein [Mycolicibacterium llatzerense]
MAELGMDADLVEQAGRQLKSQAASIQSLVAQLDRTVNGLTSIWQGQDATQFVTQWWPQHKKSLQAAQQHVDGLGQSALNNASEQRQASGGGSGGAVTSAAPAHAAGPAGSSGASVTGGVKAGQSTPGELPKWNESAYRQFESQNRYYAPGNYYIDANGKAVDNCTAWAAWRREELGLSAPSGNGGEMAGKVGGTTSTPPTLGALVSDTTPGYGHVMVVEQINPDGSFRVSETNYNGSSSIHMRTWAPLADGTWKCKEDGQVRDLVIAP